MRFFHHFALEVDEESIADELERGKVCPIKFAHILKEGKIHPIHGSPDSTNFVPPGNCTIEELY